MRLRSFLFFIFLSAAGHAQYKRMLHKTFTQKTPALIDFYGNVLKDTFKNYLFKDNLSQLLESI
jgi:hypothetical protein